MWPWRVKMPTQNLLRLLLLLMLIVRIMLATVCYRFGSWRLNLRYDFGKMNSTLGSVVPLAMFSTLLTNLMLHYIFSQNKSTVLDKITLPGENEPKSRRWRGWTRRGRWWVSACPPVRQSCQREERALDEQWSGPDDAFKDCLRHNCVGQWSGPDMTKLPTKRV